MMATYVLDNAYPQFGKLLQDCINLLYASTATALCGCIPCVIMITTMAAEKLQSLFLQLGVPDTVTLDNRTTICQQFMRQNGVQTCNVSPCQSNFKWVGRESCSETQGLEGLARMKDGFMVYCLSRFLLMYQNIQQQTTRLSPAELPIYGKNIINTGPVAS